MLPFPIIFFIVLVAFIVVYYSAKFFSKTRAHPELRQVRRELRQQRRRLADDIRRQQTNEAHDERRRRQLRLIQRTRGLPDLPVQVEEQNDYPNETTTTDDVSAKEALSDRFLRIQESLTTNPVSDSEKNQDCSICLDSFRLGESIATVKHHHRQDGGSDKERCMHYFHQECIQVWLRRHDNCPLCRATILLASSDQDHEAATSCVETDSPV